MVSNLFGILGFNDIAGLSTMDYVTLAVIENYFEFKVSHHSQQDK